MTLTEAQSYNALVCLHESNYKLLQSLLIRHGSWRAAFLAQNKKENEALRLWEDLVAYKVRLILPEDLEFPAMLREIPWPPLGLYVRGLLPEGFGVGVVGTRKATSHGLALARDFSLSFARAGIPVVSGLALWIDTGAHKGALEGKGITVAVLAGGLNMVYPRQNESLAREILEVGGALVSEYPCGAPAYPQRFLERNRIVSGMSRGVVVIEAPLESGSLRTARFALDQNRDVFVVPGSVAHANYRGSHDLIKSGAALVTEAEDILKEFGMAEPSEKSSQKVLLLGLDDEQRKIVEVLARESEGLSLDDVAGFTGLSVPDAGKLLTMLIFQNIIREDGGKFIMI